MRTSDDPKTPEMQSPYFMYSKEEVLKELKSSSMGLTASESRVRLEKYGPNELEEGHKKTPFLIFLEQFRDFLVIILILAAVISAFLGDAESSLVIVLVITLNAILGTVQHIKAEQSLSSLKQMSAPGAKVLRDGCPLVIPAGEVVPGDIVLLEAGDSICADGRLIDCASLKINESALTGESLSVEKKDTSLAGDAALADRINMVYSGSFVTYGRGSFVVSATGMETEVGKIARLLKNTSAKKTPLQENLDNFGKKLAAVILVICALLFAVSLLRGESAVNAFMFAVALAVAAIPEALSSIVTIVLAFGTRKMAKENAIVRKLQAVEGLGSVSVICSDKTGTLTQNKMTVERFYTDAQVYEAGAGSLPEACAKGLLAACVLCNDASAEDGREIGDPTETALITFAAAYHVLAAEYRKRYPRLDEVPFDSDRKLMSTLHTINGKRILITKGAVDVLPARISSILTEEGIRPVTEEDRDRILDVNRRFSEQGLRVLAFACKEYDGTEKLTLKAENGLTFLGLAAMMDPPREEAEEAVKRCKEAGIRPVMITGDHKITAAAIAKKIGILSDGRRAVEGREIDSLSEEELKAFVEDVSVYARVTPEQKIRIVRAWQDKGNIVSMTGDGVNDAPALKQADIGVAMGITGTDVSKDASSMILTDDNFATIVKAVENGRNVYANIKKSIRFLLSGNTAGILAVVFASVCGLPLPFAPVHLLFINLLTDSLPAIALGLDPHTSAVMKEKPRPRKESILTADFLFGIAAEGLVISITTMTSYFIGLSMSGAAAASTMAFATLCLSRLVHGFNSKSQRPVLFHKSMWNNRFLIGAFVLGFLLLNAVLLLSPLARVFQVTALSAGQLFAIYGMSVSNLFIIQLIKWLRCRRKTA